MVEIDKISEVHHVQGPNPEPYSIKVEKGQKGGYAWEIGAKGADYMLMIDQLKAIDTELRVRFGGDT
jgi:hypothetical protein